MPNFHRFFAYGDYTLQQDWYCVIDGTYERCLHCDNVKSLWLMIRIIGLIDANPVAYPYRWLHAC